VGEVAHGAPPLPLRPPRPPSVPAARAASHYASSPRQEPSCQEVMRAPEDARVGLERSCEHQNHAIQGITEASCDIRVDGT
jgi:hypothetical protein